MKKAYFTIASILLAGFVFLSSCGGGGDPKPKTLIDLLKNTTWKLGTVIKGGADVTNPNFTGFLIQINANGTSGQITPATGFSPVTISYNIQEAKITTSNNIIKNSVGTWGLTANANTSLLDAAAVSSNGATFTFKVQITNDKGQDVGIHQFNLVKN
jgi:hypothetical protein